LIRSRRPIGYPTSKSTSAKLASCRKQGSTWTYYTFDQQGNVSQRLNASGTVVSSSVYDAYGAETTSGTAPTDACGYNAQWGYWLDRDTGLYLCQARWYDPVTGRWVTRDPIGYAGGANLYGYCGGGPVGWTDPIGRKPLVIVRGDMKGGRDISRYAAKIIDDYVYYFGEDDVAVVSNAEEAYEELSAPDATGLVSIGHNAIDEPGPWYPDVNTAFDTEYGDRVDPHEIGRRRGKRKLAFINLTLCDSLAEPATAAAWKRLTNDLRGSYGPLPISWYAWGWTTLDQYPPSSSTRPQQAPSPQALTPIGARRGSTGNLIWD